MGLRQKLRFLEKKVRKTLLLLLPKLSQSNHQQAVRDFLLDLGLFFFPPVVYFFFVSIRQVKMKVQKIKTNSEKKTKDFAKKFALSLKPGSTLCLYGELG